MRDLLHAFVRGIFKAVFKCFYGKALGDAAVGLLYGDKRGETREQPHNSLWLFGEGSGTLARGDGEYSNPSNQSAPEEEGEEKEEEKESNL